MQQRYNEQLRSTDYQKNLQGKNQIVKDIAVREEGGVRLNRPTLSALPVLHREQGRGTWNDGSVPFVSWDGSSVLLENTLPHV